MKGRVDGKHDSQKGVEHTHVAAVKFQLYPNRTYVPALLEQ
mgnify:CR=1 FL=1